MFRKRQPKPVSAVFRGYFRKQRINFLVKNLYLVIPEISQSSRRAWQRMHDRSLRFMIGLFKIRRSFRSPPGLRKKIDVFDLSALNDHLALHLKHTRKRTIRLSADTKVNWQNIPIKQTFERQG